MTTKKHIVNWLLFAFFTETICGTYALKIAKHTAIVSVIYFLAGVSIATLILFITSKEKNRFPAPVTNKFGQFLRWLVFAAMIGMSFIVARYWFDLIPIDIDYADMLPVIHVMNERFINGQWRHVYDTIPEIWNGTNPVYLPAMWLPFSPAVLFNFDMRWITVACLVFAFSAFLFRLDFNNKTIRSYLLVVIAGLLFWWLFAHDDSHGLLSMSEEGVVIFFHVILVLALFSGNIVFIAIATSLCMLSRYLMIGWIPAFILYLILNKRKKDIFIFCITGILSFLFLFIIPFGWNAFVRLLTLPGKYVDFSALVWRDSREVFWLSLGFAKFFGPKNTETLHNLLITLTFLVPLLFVISCHFIKQKIKIDNIPLATLKLSVVVFLNFIDVPYLYLFYTSSFISLIMIGRLVRNWERETLNATA
jgi:hypothetical protein